MDPELKLLDEVEEKGGVPSFVLLSFVIHGLLLALWAAWRPPAVVVPAAPVRYVEFVQQPQPQQQARGEAPTIMEAPGPALERPVNPNAPLSSANRRASTPRPTGDVPTPTPGDNRPRGESLPSQRPGAPAPQQVAGGRTAAEQGVTDPRGGRLEYKVASAAALGTVDWNAAIRDAGKVASEAGGGPTGIGGEGGLADTGPISFETQWFEWGDYSDQMVRKIRRHWYANMPDIIKMGVKGVVAIRFTIERSGAISEVVILKSSGVPPFDYAAKKGIELASPLNPLPANFPYERERVNAIFYYNVRVPRSGR